MTLDQGCPAALVEALLAALVALADRDPAKVTTRRSFRVSPPCRTSAFKRLVTPRAEVSRAVVSSRGFFQLSPGAWNRPPFSQILQVYASRLCFYCDSQSDLSMQDQVAEVNLAEIEPVPATELNTSIVYRPFRL